MNLIYCRGGDKLAPKVCQASGWGYGTRHDYVPYMPPTMLDIKWDDYDWADYLSKVERYRPALAMAPDYFDTTPKALLLEQIAQVKEAGATEVMVCPKFLGAVADIPEWCIVAVSVPAPTYAGFLPPADELQGRRLHFLGGGPDQWLYLQRFRYATAQVVSADCNYLAYKAQLGMWWSARRADWIQTPKGRFSNLTLMIQSARRISEYVHNPRSVIRFGAAVRRCIDVPAAPNVEQHQLFA